MYQAKSSDISFFWCYLFFFFFFFIYGGGMVGEVAEVKISKLFRMVSNIFRFWNF